MQDLLDASATAPDRGPNKLLAFKVAADRSSLSVRSLQRLVKRREFPAPLIVSPNRLAFLEAEVEAWIAGRPRAA